MPEVYNAVNTMQNTKFGINDDNGKTHYLDRPYEIDAYIKQEQLLEEYRLCS